MTAIPNSWRVAKLGEIYSVLGGGTPSTEKTSYWGQGYPWITSADIIGIREIQERRFVTEEGVLNSTTTLVPPQSLLVVTRVGLGKIAIAPRQMCFSQDLQGLVQDPALILPEYTLHYLSFELQRMKFEARGTTISGLTKKQLTDTRIPIPPFDEQRRIVVKIDELYSELENSVESLTSAQVRLKAYQQSLLKHAFNGTLTGDVGNPKWRPSYVGAEIDYLTSGSRGWADYYSKKGAVFIRAQDLKYDRLDLDECAFVDLPATATEGTRTLVQRGDVLITITGANVTKTGVVNGDIGRAYVSQHVALCRPGPSLLPAYLYWYLLSESGGRRQLTEAAYGAGKPGLNLENIRSVSIPVPPIEKQLEVVSIIEAGADAERGLTGVLS